MFLNFKNVIKLHALLYYLALDVKQIPKYIVEKDQFSYQSQNFVYEYVVMQTYVMGINYRQRI